MNISRSSKEQLVPNLITSSAIRGLEHATQIAKVFRDNSGIYDEIPVIVTENGPLEPLLDYLLSKKHCRSISWMKKNIQAVGLLLDYMSANHDCFDEPKLLFEAFVSRMYTGTIGDDGIDPSGLYWLPKRTKNVNQLVSYIVEFTDWLSDKKGTKTLNPWWKATKYEEMLYWAGYYQKNARVFLSHTKDKGEVSRTAKKARSLTLKNPPVVDDTGVLSFPESRILDLLFKGFIVPGQQNNPDIFFRINLRDVLITLLLHYGGLRESEPFHLYVHDVIDDPDDSSVSYVRVFHPSEGQAPNDWYDANRKPIKCNNRAAYLQGKYHLKPRNEVINKTYHAGWKDSLLDDKTGNYFVVQWFPSWAGRLFKVLWNRHMMQRALMNCNHPFAFVTMKGNPHSLAAYMQAHSSACKRIGLYPAKINGTTPHAHRHAYGQRCAEGEVNSLTIKKAMHHKSIESQTVYTEPNIKLVTNSLNKAISKLEKRVPETSLDFLEKYLKVGFDDVDPLGLFSGEDPKLIRKIRGNGSE